MSRSSTTRHFICRVKSTITFTSKFKSESACHIKANTPHSSSSSAAGWCIGGGLPRNLFLSGVKLPSRSLKNPAQVNQQYVRSFRNSKSREPRGALQESGIGKGTWRPPSNDSGHQNMSDRFSLFYKPLGFVAFIGASSFAACTVWRYEVYRNTLSRDRAFAPGSWRIPNLGPGEPQTVINLGVIRSKVGSLRAKVNSWWSQVPDAEKVFWVICGINAAVFLAWRVRAFSPSMVTYFTASPNSRAVCWPMLFSTFSHYSFYHFAINMFVLHSFMPAAINVLGKEQFVSVYLTAGVVSSLGSHIQKILTNTNIPSLGASGAIMAILGLVCMKYPDIQLGIIFIPGLNFSADTALKCMIAVDTVGILIGWKFIDHAAHLSGTLFGIAVSKYGYHLTPVRDLIMEAWHNFRNRTAG